jgi:hypothetical protein
MPQLYMVTTPAGTRMWSADFDLLLRLLFVLDDSEVQVIENKAKKVLDETSQ